MMTVHTDACKKDRHIGLGWHIEENGETVVTGREYLKGSFTSMEAECMALIRAMRSVLRYASEHITFYTDCLPLVDHLDNENSISDDGGFIETVERYEKYLPPHMLMWTPRENNEVADREAHVAVDEALAEA